ncbi:RAE1 geranylgeranyltransferase, partial [Illadopsis cleaveri]|nr:RAE1 geranylgeranyltransferase [Illadopsis cleaveri]
QDSAEGVEEAGALPKLPVFGAPAAQGVSPGSEENPAAEGISLGSEESPTAEGVSPGPEKENPAVESPREEPQTPEAEQAPGTEPARAAAGAGAGTAPGSGTVPSAASGESAPEPAKTEPASSENAAQEPKKITYSQIVREGRRFNIDLVSKNVFSKLNASLFILCLRRFFKPLETEKETLFSNSFSSLADVFNSRQLTMVEKRMLMKFLTFCLDYEQHPEEYQ